MLPPARRSALRATRQLRSVQQRRLAHDNHHHAAEAGESIGRGFFLAVATIPVCYAVYTLSRPSADGKSTYFTDLIDQFTTKREEWERRNTLHTQMIEQAAYDRNLFNSEQKSQQIPIKFQEQFNVGSAVNVPAGHYSNIDHVIGHYKEQNAKQAEKTRARLQRGEQID